MPQAPPCVSLTDYAVMLSTGDNRRLARCGRGVTCCARIPPPAPLTPCGRNKLRPSRGRARRPRRAESPVGRSPRDRRNGRVALLRDRRHLGAATGGRASSLAALGQRASRPLRAAARAVILRRASSPLVWTWCADSSTSGRVRSCACTSCRLRSWSHMYPPPWRVANCLSVAWP